MTEQEAMIRFDFIRCALLGGTKPEIIPNEDNVELIDIAINALEEVQQYREIGTVAEIKANMEELKRWHTDKTNPKIKNVFANTSTLLCHNCDHKDDYIEYLQDYIDCKDDYIEDMKDYIEKLEAEIDEYRTIGTVDECRAAREKQKPKKPKEYEDKFYGCPSCGNALLQKWEKYNTKLMDKKNGLPYCLGCGQRLDWSDEDE